MSENHDTFTVKEMADFLSVPVEDLTIDDLMQCSDFQPRPSLTLKTGELPRATRRLHKILVEHSRKTSTVAADRVFRRLGEIVHLNRNEIKAVDIISDEDGRPVDKDYHVADELCAMPASDEWLCDLGERVASVGRMTMFGISPADIPLKLVRRLYSIKAEWRFSELAGTVETPTLRRDGSLLDRPGYDRRSGLYYDPHGVVFPPVTDKPTKSQAMVALAVLKKVLIDFPFADEDGIIGLSLSVALAGMLTAVVRRVLPTAPLFGVDANEVESGKTLLTQIWAIMMTGKRTAARPLSMDPYQQATALAAAFEASDGFILFDNVDEPIHGAPLEMAITSDVFTMRRLGGNSADDQVKAPSNSMMAATGNKLKAAGDMAGNRMVECKIVPDIALADRKFQHDPLDEYVIAHRPLLVTAALTIMRAYIVAGRPERGKHLKFRLTEWRELVADPLIWLGEVDPCVSAARVIATDPVRDRQLTIMRALRKAFRVGARFTTTQALAVEDVAEALNEVLGGAAYKSMVTPTAKLLDGMTGVRFGRYRLRKLGATGTHAAHWFIQAIKNDGEDGDLLS